VKKLEKLIPWINPKKRAIKYFANSLVFLTFPLIENKLKIALIKMVTGIRSSIT